MGSDIGIKCLILKSGNKSKTFSTLLSLSYS